MTKIVFEGGWFVDVCKVYKRMRNESWEVYDSKEKYKKTTQLFS